MLTGKTSQDRELHEEILSHIIQILFKKLEAEEPMVDREHLRFVIIRITSEMLELIGSEAHKFWHKIGSFLNFFHKMVNDGNPQRTAYFMQ